MSEQKTVELSIDKLAVGGDGLAFLEGKAIFVPFSLPGERVRAVLGGAGASKRDWSSAEITEILTPSPDRVEPRCPLFGACGGCSLQHIDYPRQTHEKAAILADCFLRTGGLEVPDIDLTPSEPYGYRNRMQFHLTPQGRLGLMRRGSVELVDIPTCPVAALPIREWMESRSGRTRDDLASYVDKDRFLVFASGSPGEAGGRLYVEGRDGEARAIVAGREIEFHVKGFFQSNLEALNSLVPAVTAGLSGKRAADLYCGVGLFGSFLKESFTKVICVEHNPFALEYARRNVGPTGEYHDLAVEDWVKAPAARANFDAVVVDPPRTGLAPAVREWLAARKIPAVSYVSCDPATLARDLKALVSSGYAIESVHVYDFFPQTGHVETHVRLRYA
jgi:23S rRNA (uracil1939-C5)-methyltransferase